MSTLITSTAQIGTIKDAAGNANAMTIDSSGRVLTPARPSFSAFLNGTVSYGSANTAQKVTFNATHHNVGGHYSTSTGKFTAPLTGVYFLSACVYVYSVQVGEIQFYINGTSTYRFAVNSNAGNAVNPNGGQGSITPLLTANDEVEVYVYASDTGTIYDGSGATKASFWTGCLIG